MSFTENPYATFRSPFDGCIELDDLRCRAQQHFVRVFQHVTVTGKLPLKHLLRKADSGKIPVLVAASFLPGLFSGRLRAGVEPRRVENPIVRRLETRPRWARVFDGAGRRWRDVWGNRLVCGHNLTASCNICPNHSTKMTPSASATATTAATAPSAPSASAAAAATRRDSPCRCRP